MSDLDPIPIGYVRRPHGIRGDVVVRGLISDASDRMVTGTTLRDEAGLAFDVTSHREHRGDILLHLGGVDDRTTAESLVGTRFVIAAGDRRTLDADEWWPEDLIGCAVVDGEGHPVGEVVDTVSGSAQDRLVVVALDGRRAEVPLVDALVPIVDTAGGRVVVDLPDGLFEPGPDDPG